MKIKIGPLIVSIERSEKIECSDLVEAARIAVRDNMKATLSVIRTWLADEPESS